MKRNTSILFLMLLSFYISSPLLAGNKNIVDDVLQVRKTLEAPVIDGIMDNVWLITSAQAMVLSEGRSLDTLVSFDDHYAAFRALWDDDNFYIFMSVVDDSIKVEADVASPWLNDCIEIFFDGQNEKATSYDANDVQWRYVYGETPDNRAATAAAVPGVWAWAQTSSGYNFELSISRDSLASKFDLEADQEIGFEISNGDLETASSPQTVLHWWTNNGLTWNDPSLFGTAVLTGVELNGDGVIEIHYAEDKPNIDGQMDEGEGWEASEEYSFARFEGAPDANLQDSTFTSWRDHQASFWLLWDEDYFYAFAKVVDDSLYGGAEANVSSPWLNDCVEIFFDGENDKATSYDANDIQWRWVLNETVDENPASNGVGDWAWEPTDLGYNFELRIPKDSLAVLFPLEQDHEIGFEISNGDLETINSPQRVLHWWTNVATTWNDPSLFGTATLMGTTGVIRNDKVIATDYTLSQNYPNPFNPATKINYTIPSNEKVKLVVYDLFGKQVAVLFDGYQGAGSYTVDFNAQNLASGIYFFRLQAGNNILARKMTLLK